MRTCIVLLAVVVLGCGGGGGGGDGDPTGPGPGPGPGPAPGNPSSTTATVGMRSSDDGYGTATFSFNPAGVTLSRGGTVTWQHEGGNVVHNVTFTTNGAPANVENLSTGTASRVFGAAGTFNYNCTNHPGMSGSVTVQ